jgi:hypothetical protein
MKQSGYEHRWCKRCDHRTFHWFDDSSVFPRRECDQCGLRSGVDVMFWIKRFAVPVAIGITVLVSYEPARNFFHL